MEEIADPYREVCDELRQIRNIAVAIYQPSLRTGQAAKVLFDDLFGRIDHLKQYVESRVTRANADRPQLRLVERGGAHG